MPRPIFKSLDPTKFLESIGKGHRTFRYARKQAVFSQGDRADSVHYIREGKVKISVLSKQGKEATIALLGPGDFFGEGCMAGQPLRMATAVSMGDSSIVRIDKKVMIEMLRKQNDFSELFLKHLIARNIRIEEDLVDQLFNSSEKRLARLLLLLATLGKEGKPEVIVPKISQEALAEMIGTTRSRVSHFMNKFRRLGFIHYNGGLKVHSSLINIILHG